MFMVCSFWLIAKTRLAEAARVSIRGQALLVRNPQGGTMTTAFRIGLLALVSVALGAGTSSWAQDKCTACLNDEFGKCMRLLNSAAPAAPGKPAPVEASGQSMCPDAARNECRGKKLCQ
jgi:hypothetical protein